MANSNVSISFGADASDFLDGVARVSAALQDLADRCRPGRAQASTRSSQSFSAFGAGAANALAKIGRAAREAGASQQEVARASLSAINGEIFAERAALAEKKSLYDELTKLKVMSASERLAATQAALDEEYAAERSLLEKELQLGDLSLQQRRADPEPDADARREICARQPEDHAAVGRADGRADGPRRSIRWRPRSRPG